jgi:hypothetical protein
VKDTGGMAAGRSAALQSAEQQAQQVDDEYGGHPEAPGRARISAYEVRDDEAEDERDPKEIEREKYGDGANNLALFGSLLQPLPVRGAPPVTAKSAARQPVAGAKDDPIERVEADRDDNGSVGVRMDVSLRGRDDAAGAREKLSDDEDEAGTEAFNDLVASAGEATATDSSFAVHAAAFHESPITPELNALEIVPLEGIRDAKVKEIAVEIPYATASEETVKRIRELVEQFQGEVPLSVVVVALPAEVAQSAGCGELRLKISQHFRVKPGIEFTNALQKLQATARYLF